MMLRVVCLSLLLWSLADSKSFGKSAKQANWDFQCPEGESISNVLLDINSDDGALISDFRIKVYCTKLGSGTGAQQRNVTFGECYESSPISLFSAGFPGSDIDYSNGCDRGDVLTGIKSEFDLLALGRSMVFTCCPVENAELYEEMGCHEEGPFGFFDPQLDIHDSVSVPTTCPADAITGYKMTLEGIYIQYCPFAITELQAEYEGANCKMVKFSQQEELGIEITTLEGTVLVSEEVTGGSGTVGGAGDGSTAGSGNIGNYDDADDSGDVEQTDAQEVSFDFHYYLAELSELEEDFEKICPDNQIASSCSMKAKDDLFSEPDVQVAVRCEEVEKTENTKDVTMETYETESLEITNFKQKDGCKKGEIVAGIVSKFENGKRMIALSCGILEGATVSTTTIVKRTVVLTGGKSVAITTENTPGAVLVNLWFSYREYQAGKCIYEYAVVDTEYEYDIYFNKEDTDNLADENTELDPSEFPSVVGTGGGEGESEEDCDPENDEECTTVASTTVAVEPPTDKEIEKDFKTCETMSYFKRSFSKPCPGGAQVERATMIPAEDGSMDFKISIECEKPSPQKGWYQVRDIRATQYVTMMDMTEDAGCRRGEVCTGMNSKFKRGERTVSVNCATFEDAEVDESTYEVEEFIIVPGEEIVLETYSASRKIVNVWFTMNSRGQQVVMCRIARIKDKRDVSKYNEISIIEEEDIEPEEASDEDEDSRISVKGSGSGGKSGKGSGSGGKSGKGSGSGSGGKSGEGSGTESEDEDYTSSEEEELELQSLTDEQYWRVKAEKITEFGEDFERECPEGTSVQSVDITMSDDGEDFVCEMTCDGGEEEESSSSEEVEMKFTKISNTKFYLMSEFSEEYGCATDEVVVGMISEIDEDSGMRKIAQVCGKLDESMEFDPESEVVEEVEMSAGSEVEVSGESGMKLSSCSFEERGGVIWIIYKYARIIEKRSSSEGGGSSGSGGSGSDLTEEEKELGISDPSLEPFCICMCGPTCDLTEPEEPEDDGTGQPQQGSGRRSKRQLASLFGGGSDDGGDSPFAAFLDGGSKSESGGASKPDVEFTEKKEFVKGKVQIVITPTKNLRICPKDRCNCECDMCKKDEPENPDAPGEGDAEEESKSSGGGGGLSALFG